MSAFASICCRGLDEGGELNTCRSCPAAADRRFRLRPEIRVSLSSEIFHGPNKRVDLVATISEGNLLREITSNVGLDFPVLYKEARIQSTEKAIDFGAKGAGKYSTKVIQ